MHIVIYNVFAAKIAATVERNLNINIRFEINNLTQSTSN